MESMLRGEGQARARGRPKRPRLTGPSRRHLPAIAEHPEVRDALAFAIAKVCEGAGAADGPMPDRDEALRGVAEALVEYNRDVLGR